MENVVPHPSAFIDKDNVNTIRNAAPQAEYTGLLQPEQLAVIYQQNWFKLLVPQIYNGLQITLPQLVKLQEAISWADGSTGWVVTLCSGAGWFGGFLLPETARQVFKDPHVCLAGSGAAGGTAEITKNGFIINGTWKYASGAHHATYITANCVIKKDGKPVLTDEGQPLILPFIVDRKDVTLLPAWKYIGMMATGSDAFEIKDLEVAINRQFKIDPSTATVNDPLYHYPFLQMAQATLSVNLSGIAIHFMDLCENIFDEKVKQPRLTNTQKAFLTGELALVKKTLNAQRNYFFDAVEQSWEALQNNAPIAETLLNAVSNTSLQLAALAREGVDKLYPLCGLAAAGTNTDINRAWRDLHTASQHALLTFVV